MGVYFEGAKELTDKIKKCQDLDIIKKIVAQNGAEMQQKAQTNSPVDTGTLKRSIDLQLSSGNMTATVEPHTEYAAYVEYGTRKMEARPYMKEAFDAQKKQFKSDLKRAVE